MTQPQSVTIEYALAQAVERNQLEAVALAAVAGAFGDGSLAELMQAGEAGALVVCDTCGETRRGKAKARCLMTGGCLGRERQALRGPRLFDSLSPSDSKSPSAEAAEGL